MCQVYKAYLTIHVCAMTKGHIWVIFFCVFLNKNFSVCHLNRSRLLQLMFINQATRGCRMRWTCRRHSRLTFVFTRWCWWAKRLAKRTWTCLEVLQKEHLPALPFSLSGKIYICSRRLVRLDLRGTSYNSTCGSTPLRQSFRYIYRDRTDLYRWSNKHSFWSQPASAGARQCSATAKSWSSEVGGETWFLYYSLLERVSEFVPNNLLYRILCE